MPDTPLDKLKRLTAWTTEPALTETELGELLFSSAMTDVNGFAPTDSNWQATYDLNKAAAEAWLIKAGRVSDLVEVDPPGSGIYTSKVFENCLALAAVFRARSRGFVRISMPPQ